MDPNAIENTIKMLTVASLIAGILVIAIPVIGWFFVVKVRLEKMEQTIDENKKESDERLKGLELGKNKQDILQTEISTSLKFMAETIKEIKSTLDNKMNLIENFFKNN